MSTRSSTRNLFPPLDNPELTIRRRPRVDPTLLNDFEMATNRNGDDVPPPGGGDLQVPDLRTMEEFIKVNGVTDDALRLYLFPHSLTHHATAWFDRLPRNSITTFEQMAKMFLGKYFPPSMVTKLRNEVTNFCQRPDESLFKAWERYKLSVDRCPNHNMLPITHIDTFYNGLTFKHRDTINAAAGGTFMKRCPEECYDLIEDMTLTTMTGILPFKGPPFAKLRTYMLHEPIIKVVILTSLKETVICLAIVQTIISDHQGLIKIKTETIQIRTTKIKIGIKETTMEFLRRTTKKETSSSKELVIVKTHLQLIKHQLIKRQVTKLWYIKPRFLNRLGTLSSNTITNPEEDLKGITTRSGNAYQRPTIPTTSSLPKVVERETEVTKDTVPPTNNGSTKDVQPPPNLKPSIPYPSRLHGQKIRDKTNDQKKKFFKIFQDLDFNISFADALILIPKFVLTIKSLLTNKEKLFELARTPLNEHCSVVLLKKLPEKLGDPGKFLISCDFLGMDECLALADLGASINLMPLSIWNKLFLPKLSPTCMTLELVDRLISRLVGVVEDVFVKVGTFHFSADFVVIDFDADPRVPLILKRSFLKTECALIDVYEGELTLHIGKEVVTFNLDQTSSYSANYDAMSVNQIYLIDVACEEYSQEVLGFFVSGNPTPSTELIVSTSSPTLTPFGDSDFLLEEIDAFLAIDDEPISSKIDESYYDSEGDILLLEEFLNDDPSSPPLPP
nr:reverse transcriptase domain-containing protein [Tanacetum cinerariifolium]